MLKRRNAAVAKAGRDEALPLCTTEWESVLGLHELRYPGQGRTVDSIKRKFSSLYRRQIPTGDPHIPPEVRKAKSIRLKMTERADMGDGTEGGGLLSSGDELDNDGDDSQIQEGSDEIEQQFDDQDQTSDAFERSLSTQYARPLVSKRMKTASSDQASSIYKMMEMQMLMEEQRRSDEREIREQERIRRDEERELERKLREEERREERERREIESRERREQHKEFMTLVAMILGAKQHQ
ncbi:hypothetical protein AC1031_004977 [Aphanomyces cochlioides]|nr:hypothetical protein AC1031_004977 [Aphanomyces cochlioides]